MMVVKITEERILLTTGSRTKKNKFLSIDGFFLEVLPMAAGKLKRFGCSSDFVASDILPIFLLKSYNDKAWFLSFQLEANLF